MIKKIGGWGNFLLLLIFISVAIYVLYEKSNLIEKSRYTEGIVLGKSTGVKGNRHLDYQFEVNGHKFRGFVSSSFCKDCNCCDTGDTVVVRYEEGNPDNNDLVKRYPNEELEQ